MSCTEQDNHTSKNVDDLGQVYKSVVQTKSFAYLPCSPTVLHRTSSNANLTDSSLQRQSALKIIADPKYYHTVHGGRKKQVTASRCTDPLAPITRINIGDRSSFLQAYQPKVKRAYSAASNPRNKIAVEKGLFLKLVRPSSVSGRVCTVDWDP